MEGVRTCPKCGVVPQSPNPNLRTRCVRCDRRLVLTPRVTEVHRHGEPFFDRHLTPGSAIFPPYAAMVLARFHQASGEYGETWRLRPLDDIAGEAGEEGLDVGGWTMLIQERLQEVPADVRPVVAALIADMIAEGARVTAKARTIQALLRHTA